MSSKFRGQPGYAITEVLVATVVLSIGLIELTNAFSNISRVANQAVAITKSSNLAHATMERVISNSFDAKGNEAEDYSLIFDGSDYVDVGNVFDGIQTISFWLDVDDVGAGIINIVGLNNIEYVRINNGTLQSNIAASTFYVNGIQDATSIGSANRWYHVAITTTTPVTADNVQIGRLAATGATFSGMIDEVRLWNDVRTASEILSNYQISISNPFSDSNLKLYLQMNRGSGDIIYDHSASMVHGSKTGATWTNASASWSATLGREGEITWSGNNDVDDFHTLSFVDSDYSGLDAGSNNFSGLGGRVYVKYVSLNTGGSPHTFDDSGTPTDYKQITVKIGIPGSTDSTQLNAIKTAKANQGYTLTFSPYGL
jgi:hypothetical protein|tara:strand:- start:464 stop:1576 length:1113 start_codon:yes stop_codon:yes gene_type:complete